MSFDSQIFRPDSQALETNAFNPVRPRESVDLTALASYQRRVSQAQPLRERAPSIYEHSGSHPWDDFMDHFQATCDRNSPILPRRASEIQPIFPPQDYHRNQIQTPAQPLVRSDSITSITSTDTSFSTDTIFANNEIGNEYRDPSPADDIYDSERDDDVQYLYTVSAQATTYSRRGLSTIQEQAVINPNPRTSANHSAASSMITRSASRPSNNVASPDKATGKAKRKTRKSTESNNTSHADGIVKSRKR